jgi:hypothetical protein
MNTQLDKYPQVEWLNNMVGVSVTFKATGNLFHSGWIILPAKLKSFICFMSSPTFVMLILFNFVHSYSYILRPNYD